MAEIRTIEKKTTKVSIKMSMKKSGLSLIVYNLDGKENKTVELPKEVFAVATIPSLLAQSVRTYLVNQRQGNVKVKTRSEVTGSTRKIYRQKGTGKARHGAIKAPIFVGGGVAHGPKQKEYNLKFNKKERKLALFGVLSDKLKEKKLLGLSDKALTTEPKTKVFVNFLKVLGLSNKNNLVVLSKMEKSNLIFAMRNIPKVTFIDVMSLNPYLALKSNNIIFLEKSLEVFQVKA